jgi:CYTH domain-containing protein
MSGLEIERKFLVRNDGYKRQAFCSSRIQQGYICSGHGRTVRVRIRDNRGYLTIKGPSNAEGLSRYEFEKEITLDEAEHLMALCELGGIEKTRWLVKSGNHTFEVDEFLGDNEGLVMAEVELGSEDESFEKPDFIGEEVTGDRRYYNAHLTKYPFKTWGENAESADQSSQPVSHP